MRTNAKLKAFYDGVYKKGERAHYTQFRLQTGDLPAEFSAVFALIDWEGKEVLDVGCGTGDMCALIAGAGAKRSVGIDFAESAITEANKKYQAPNLTFICGDVADLEDRFDVVISNGTLEHMDDPLKTLRQLKTMLKPGGSLIMTCPNWLNARGYILQTLWHMFRAPITLADIHYLGPVDFEGWARELEMDLEWSTVDCEWGSGMKMVKDLERRLPNVARDAGWQTTKEQIDGFLQWIETKVVPFKDEGKHAGAAGVYHLKLRS
ncbi:class I SAM-dependent methyltransferase [Candidatus Peregrinibacteria bacterium]|nr:class I SAM-dependent methyltransferase [Candidatus Peregrinibacteria bacterium]